MSVEFRCSQCQRLLRTPDEVVGQQARCPQCGLVQTVPATAQPADAPAEPQPVYEASFQPGSAPDSDNPYQSSAIPPGQYESYVQYALNQVSLPATLLMIGGVIGTLGSVCGHLSLLAHPQWRVMQGGFALSWASRLIWIFVALAVNLLICLGAAKMKNLQNYGLSLTAAILALLPLSCCCLYMLPVGIWALVVLNDPYVKAVFRR